MRKNKKRDFPFFLNSGRSENKSVGILFLCSETLLYLLRWFQWFGMFSKRKSQSKVIRVSFFKKKTRKERGVHHNFVRDVLLAKKKNEKESLETRRKKLPAYVSISHLTLWSLPELYTRYWRHDDWKHKDIYILANQNEKPIW